MPTQCAAPAGFHVEVLRGVHRPAEDLSISQLADQISRAIQFANVAGLREILVDISAARGFNSPGPAYRRWIIRRWTGEAGPGLRVAIVARAEHIAPEKSGLLLAAEEGLRAHVFETEAEAAAWLG